MVGKADLPAFIDDSSRTVAIAVERYEIGHEKIKNLIYLGNRIKPFGRRGGSSWSSYDSIR